MNPSVLLALFGLFVVAKKPATGGAAPATGATAPGSGIVKSGNTMQFTGGNQPAGTVVGTFNQHPVISLGDGGVRYWAPIIGWATQYGPWTGAPATDSHPTSGGAGPGKKIGQAAGAAGGAALGTAIGGPVGGAVGAYVGGKVGGYVEGKVEDLGEDLYDYLSP